MARAGAPTLFSPFPLRPPSWQLILLLIGGLLLAGGGYAYYTGLIGGRQAAVTYQAAPVTQGTLQVVISATGPITSPTSIPLTFKNSGKLAEVDVAVGDTVKAGQVLARLDTSDLQAQVNQAQANLDAAAANEAKLQAGATPEQVAVAQAAVDAAQTGLDSAQKSLAAAQDQAAKSVAAAQSDVQAAQAGVTAARRTIGPSRAMTGL